MVRPSGHAPGGGPTGEPVRDGSAQRGSSAVAAGILLSRIAGLVRERAIGHYLGAGLAVEAFRAALRIPNLLQNLLGEGVLSASFIPVHSRLLAEGREEEAGRVAGAVAGLLLVVSGALIVAGVVFAGPITSVLAAGFSGDKRDLTVRLVRILFPGVGLLVLSAWCLGVLNSYRRFFLSYAAPVLWNAAMVAALITFGLRGVAGVSLAVALAWGTLVGGALQFAVQLPGVLRVSRGLRLRITVGIPAVRRVVRAFGPMVLGRGVVQLSAYVDLLLASFLATGAIAALTYAQVLYILPVSLFGMSVAAAELPELSRVPRGLHREVGHRLATGMSRIAFFVVPTAVAYVLAGDLITGTLYETGEFGPDTTRQVWVVLAVYALGLLATTSARLLQSALYSTGDTRTPAAIATLRVLVSGVVGVVLMLQLDRFELTAAGLTQIGDLPAAGPVPSALRDVTDNAHRLGAAGLAAAASLGAWVELALLRRVASRRFTPVALGGGRMPAILAAAAAAAAAALVSRAVAGGLPPLAGGLVAVALTGGTYLAVAWRLGLPDARALLDRLLRR